jgi:hypothetical protein
MDVANEIMCVCVYMYIYLFIYLLCMHITHTHHVSLPSSARDQYDNSCITHHTEPL